MRAPSRPSAGRVIRVLAALALSAAALASLGAKDPYRLPPILFVARQPVAGSLITPGVGPAGRAVVTRGSLVLRDADGRLYPLVAPDVFWDVAHPAVSYDGRRIVFAAIERRDAPWRLWTCDATGHELERLTADPANDSLRADDFQPCWLPDGRIAFASTREGRRLGRAGLRASNVWAIPAEGGAPVRLTAEPYGAEAPSVDPRDGRLLFARWLTSPLTVGPGGPVLDPALATASDTLDRWQPLECALDGSGLRAAGGDARTRAGGQFYSPVMLTDGTLLGVRGAPGSLTRAARLGVQCATAGGAIVPLAGSGAPRGWSACAPCALPDGRVILSMDEDGTGNFDLFLADLAGRHLEPLTQEPNSLELDVAVLAPRPLPPAGAAAARTAPLPRSLAEAPRTGAVENAGVWTNPALDAPVADAPAPAPGAHVRWYAFAGGTAPGRDSLIEVADVPVAPDGGCRVASLPAGVPLAPLLIDAHGAPLAPAGAAWPRPHTITLAAGEAVRCIGCHAGHSTMPVVATGGWDDVAPRARVRASSAIAGGTGGRAATDRRLGGAPAEVAWIANGAVDESLRLRWDEPVRARAVVLYAVGAKTPEGGPLRTTRAELVLSSGGREVARVPVSREVTGAGTRVEFPEVVIDAIEYRPLVSSGKWQRRDAVGLAEIVVEGRPDAR